MSYTNTNTNSTGNHINQTNQTGETHQASKSSIHWNSLKSPQELENFQSIHASSNMDTFNNFENIEGLNIEALESPSFSSLHFFSSPSSLIKTEASPTLLLTNSILNSPTEFIHNSNTVPIPINASIHPNQPSLLTHSSNNQQTLLNDSHQIPNSFQQPSNPSIIISPSDTKSSTNTLAHNLLASNSTDSVHSDSSHRSTSPNSESLHSNTSSASQISPISNNSSNNSSESSHINSSTKSHKETVHQSTTLHTCSDSCQHSITPISNLGQSQTSNERKRKRRISVPACLFCHKSRKACSEERPCQRCLSRGIECVEQQIAPPQNKRRKEKLLVYANQKCLMTTIEMSGASDKGDTNPNRGVTQGSIKIHTENLNNLDQYGESISKKKIENMKANKDENSFINSEKIKNDKSFTIIQTPAIPYISFANSENDWTNRITNSSVIQNSESNFNQFMDVGIALNNLNDPSLSSMQQFVPPLNPSLNQNFFIGNPSPLNPNSFQASSIPLGVNIIENDYQNSGLWDQQGNINLQMQNLSSFPSNVNYPQMQNQVQTSPYNTIKGDSFYNSLENTNQNNLQNLFRFQNLSKNDEFMTTLQPFPSFEPNSFMMNNMLDLGMMEHQRANLSNQDNKLNTISNINPYLEDIMSTFMQGYSLQKTTSNDSSRTNQKEDERNILEAARLYDKRVLKSFLNTFTYNAYNIPSGLASSILQSVYQTNVPHHLSKQKKNIFQDEVVIGNFVSNRKPVMITTAISMLSIVLNSSLVSGFAFPSGTFFCNQAFAKLVDVDLSQLTDPEFIHQDIGVHKWLKTIFSSPGPLKSLIYILQSGVDFTSYKVMLMRRDGSKIFAKCNVHFYDTFAAHIFEACDDLDNELRIGNLVINPTRSFKTWDNYEIAAKSDPNFLDFRVGKFD